MMRSTMIALSAVLPLVAGGCDDRAATTPAAPATTKPESSPKVKCPLCVSHEIEVTDQTPRAEHEGQTYFFCSKSCHERFLSDPAKFIARARARAAAATQPVPR